MEKKNQFQETKKTDKPLARLRKRNKDKLAKSGMKRGTSPLTLQKFKRIIREYHEQLYTNKLDNFGKINKFPERYKLQKLIQGKTEI